jgi:uncharacterized membrane protein YqgA involved in biofilm formation
MTFLIVYLAGAILGLVRMRDRWPARVATALMWPLGPAAFVIVLGVMLVAAAILWPLPVLAAGALAGALAWWMT